VRSARGADWTAELPPEETTIRTISPPGFPFAFRATALAFALLASSLARPARASAQEFRENVTHPCQDYWMRTRDEILECLRRDYADADAELNRVYRQKMASLGPPQREVLKARQVDWLRRYDAVLTSYYSRPWANHSIVKVLPSQIRAVRDRTAYMRAVKLPG
jgi:uncharacterized protein YecT (DUF1311 family)